MEERSRVPAFLGFWYRERPYHLRLFRRHCGGGPQRVRVREGEYFGTAPAAGLTITFSDVRGRKLNENGDMEEDIDGNEVNAGSGIKVLSASRFV